MPDGQTPKLLPIWTARIAMACSGYKAREKNNHSQNFFFQPGKYIE